jgi:tetratricopeptide (TPR) repeat protein
VIFRFQSFRLLLAPAILLAIGGCAQNNATKPSESTNPLKNLAASFLAARSFDKAVIAVRNQNTTALTSAGLNLRHSSRVDGLQYLSPVSIQLLTASATIQDVKASSADSEAKTKLRNQANQSYRTAIASLPTSYQKILETDLDATTLNALGYFLADRSQKPSDYQLAEFLTSASLAKKQRTIKSLSPKDPRIPTLIYSCAVEPGDSKAWALFKQKRYAQARKEQEWVLQIATIYGPIIKQPLSAEIPYHLAEIYLAQGELLLARSSYEHALSLSPEPELKAQMEARLAAIKAQRPG